MTGDLDSRRLFNAAVSESSHCFDMVGRKSIRDDRLLRDVRLTSHTCKDLILLQEHSEQNHCSPCDDNDNVDITQCLHYPTYNTYMFPTAQGGNVYTVDAHDG